MNKPTLPNFVRVALAGGALGLGLTACGGPTGPASLTLTPDPRSINNRGQVSTITLAAVDARGKPGQGNVRFTSVAGSLVNRSEVQLSDGTASVPFSCDAAQDSECTRSVRVVGEWVFEGQLVEAYGLVAVTTPDGGTGTDGGSGP